MVMDGIKIWIGWCLKEHGAVHEWSQLIGNAKELAIDNKSMYIFCPETTSNIDYDRCCVILCGSQPGQIGVERTTFHGGLNDVLHCLFGDCSKFGHGVSMSSF